MSEPTKIPIDLTQVMTDAKKRPFNNVVLDERGDPILIEVREDNRPIYEKEPITIRDVIIGTLSNPTPKELEDKKKPKGRQAAKMLKLVMKIEDKDNHDFTVSQMSLICKRVEVMYELRIVGLVWYAFGYEPDGEDDVADAVV